MSGEVFRPNFNDKKSASTNPFDLLLDQFRAIVREEIAAASANAPPPKLLGPEDLADLLNVPVSWVYEQSRAGNIPTHRIGKYIRFNLAEVVESQEQRKRDA